MKLNIEKTHISFEKPAHSKLTRDEILKAAGFSLVNENGDDVTEMVVLDAGRFDNGFLVNGPEDNMKVPWEIKGLNYQGQPIFVSITIQEDEPEPEPEPEKAPIEVIDEQDVMHNANPGKYPLDNYGYHIPPNTKLEEVKLEVYPIMYDGSLLDQDLSEQFGHLSETDTDIIWQAEHQLFPFSNTKGQVIGIRYRLSGVKTEIVNAQDDLDFSSIESELNDDDNSHTPFTFAPVDDNTNHNSDKTTVPEETTDVSTEPEVVPEPSYHKRDNETQQPTFGSAPANVNTMPDNENNSSLSRPTVPSGAQVEPDRIVNQKVLLTEKNGGIIDLSKVLGKAKSGGKNKSKAKATSKKVSKKEPKAKKQKAQKAHTKSQAPKKSKAVKKSNLWSIIGMGAVVLALIGGIFAWRSVTLNAVSNQLNTVQSNEASVTRILNKKDLNADEITRASDMLSKDGKILSNLNSGPTQFWVTLEKNKLVSTHNDLASKMPTNN